MRHQATGLPGEMREGLQCKEPFRELFLCRILQLKWPRGHSKVPRSPVVEEAWWCSQPMWYQQDKCVSSNFRSRTWRLHKLHQQGDEPLRLKTWLGREMLQCNKHWRNNAPGCTSISKGTRWQMWTGASLIPQPHSAPWDYPCRSLRNSEKSCSLEKGEGKKNLNGNQSRIAEVAAAN